MHVAGVEHTFRFDHDLGHLTVPVDVKALDVADLLAGFAADLPVEELGGADAAIGPGLIPGRKVDFVVGRCGRVRRHQCSRGRGGKRQSLWHASSLELGPVPGRAAAAAQAARLVNDVLGGAFRSWPRFCAQHDWRLLRVLCLSPIALE